MTRLRFELDAMATGSAARAGRLRTGRGEVCTPVFMPVGTHATVKGVSVEELEEVGSQVLLANAYHLLLRPGPEIFERLGGIHRFMNWSGSILTDSGGYQVFSLPGDRVVNEEGAIFKSYVDGARIVLSPESSIATQLAIGSDIMMAMDECVASTADRNTAVAAMQRTHRWAERSLEARGNATPALFGIVQGACFDDLRHESAATLTQLPFDGFAIGGLAVGESKGERERCTSLVTALLPPSRPRYLMGVGMPIDLLEAVDRGVDMFDCTIPSLLAKQGVAFTSTGRINVFRGVYRLSDRMLDEACSCRTCAGYSRAYLRHLIKKAEPLGWRLLTVHNLHFYHELMRSMREHILQDTFSGFRDEQRSLLERGDEEYPSVAPRVRRRRRGEEDLDRFEIRIFDEGYASVADRASGEIMHAGLDPSQEAETLYVGQAYLSERLKSPADEPLVVWDVGLGAGYNAMAVLRCCEGLASADQRPVWLVSFENDLASLRLALKNIARFPHLQCAAPNHLLRFGEWRSEQVPLVWTLVERDFRIGLEEAPPPDCIFYDPFSAQTDAELWTLECFEQIFGATADRDTELFTYSASTAARAGLLAAGFYVGSGAPTGWRSETTIAMTPRALPRATSRRRLLLGANWLDRWKRSDARFPRDVTPPIEEAITERISSHPQFR